MCIHIFYRVQFLYHLDDPFLTINSTNNDMDTLEYVYLKQFQIHFLPSRISFHLDTPFPFYDINPTTIEIKRYNGKMFLHVVISIPLFLHIGLIQ